jgi:ribonuclease P protein component
LKHADFDRVYRKGKRYAAVHMTVFYLPRPPLPQASASPELAGPRIGLTVGRVLGGAIERNRIKRRLREAVRAVLGNFHVPVDVVVNPRKSALDADFRELRNEVERAFHLIAQRCSTRGGRQ